MGLSACLYCPFSAFYSLLFNFPLFTFYSSLFTLHSPFYPFLKICYDVAMKNMIEDIQEFYAGFWIEKPVGNNALSFERRINRSIYVPPICQGTIRDLRVGEEVVFSEIFQGKEINCAGLKRFIYWPINGKHIFVFDNHNHAFFFWMACFQNGLFPTGSVLVHVDQHKDTREPDVYLDGDPAAMPLDQVFDYTQNVLNVGNFIKPALKIGLFDKVVHADRQESFAGSVFDGENFVLDIDLDIFSDSMRYIDDEIKMSAIKELMRRARVITIATSPYFMNQQDALAVLEKMLTFD